MVCSLVGCGDGGSSSSNPPSHNQVVQITIDDLASSLPINPALFGAYAGTHVLGGIIEKSSLGAQLGVYGIRSVRGFGCQIDYYHWRDMVGPLETRKAWDHAACIGNDVWKWVPKYPPVWGPDEYFSYYTSLGIEFVGTVNFGSGSAQEAANWVEYANGPSPDSACDGADGQMINGWMPNSFRGDQAAPPGYFACLRHFFGQQMPYNIRRWEVGNEISNTNTGIGEAGWTKDPNLYYLGGTDIVYDTRTTRDVDRHDWSDSMRQTSCAPDERFYVVIGPIDSTGSATVDLVELEPNPGSGESTEPWVVKQVLTGWSEGTLASAGPNDQVYEVNYSGGYLQFGDGANGQIPPCGDGVNNAYEVRVASYASGPHDGFVDFARVMKAVDPSIEVGSGHSTPPPGNVAPDVDFIVSHPYFKDDAPLNQVPDLATYRAQLMAFPTSVLHIAIETNWLDLVKQLNLDIAWTEWNQVRAYTGVGATPVYGASLDSGLYIADMLRRGIEEGVIVGSYFFLWTTTRPTALFSIDQTSALPFSWVAQPGALVFRMFDDYFGEHALPTTVTSSPTFLASFSYVPGGSVTSPTIVALGSSLADGRVAVLIINKDLSMPIDVQIDLASSIPRTGTVIHATLNSTDEQIHPGTVTNTQNDPNAVQVTVTSGIPFTQPLWITVKPHTVNMVVLPTP